MFRPKSLGLHRLGGESKLMNRGPNIMQICLRARRQQINEEKRKCQECRRDAFKDENMSYSSLKAFSTNA